MAATGESEASDRRAQLLRGVLDMCLLAILEQQPCHAYELASRVQDAGLGETSYGTIYPLITRLRRLGLLDEHPEPSAVGPPRKVFSVSAAGRSTLSTWAEQWQGTTAAVAAVLSRTAISAQDDATTGPHIDSAVVPEGPTRAGPVPAPTMSAKVHP